MKRRQPPIIIVVTIVVLAIAYFIYDRTRPHCDSIFEQTTARVGADLEFIKTKGEVFIGRAKVQELTDGSQKVALHLKTCCVLQQSGGMPPDKLQACIDGARDYDSKILQVTSVIKEAQAANDQGNRQLVEKKAGEATAAVSAATTSVGELSKVAATLPSPPTLPPARKAVKGGSEQEPNNTILQANLAEMGSSIAAEIAPPDDVDFFKFQYRDAKKRRDIIALHLENQSTTLRPGWSLYGGDKSLLRGWSFANVQGANVDDSFSADPDGVYYVAVACYENASGGRYTLSVTPQRAYDQYEPNDDSFTATPIRLGQAVEANIMDARDVDWYLLSGVKNKTVTVSLENQSQTLRPAIQVRNADKSILQGFVAANVQGANLELSFPADAGKDYYLVVVGYDQTVGRYRLSTR